MRRLVLYTVLFVLTVSCTSKNPNNSIEPTPPNVVVILADDQGWGDLSLNGNTNVSTPNIDHLAVNGARFDRFYVSPVCSPTRAELLTGRYFPRGGVYSTSAGGERLDLDETTIAEVFRKAGYATAAYGKWHNGMQPPYHPNARGFDEFYGFCSGHWGDYFSPPLEHNGAPVRGNGFLIDDFTERAMGFFEQHQNSPFFVYLAYNTPHSPMQVPDQWWGPFEGKNLDMLHRNPDREDIQHTRAALAMTENIDWNVGRLIQKIEDLELAPNTVVVYFSDNGPNGWRWNGGMKGRKGSTDEGGVRSPLIIRWTDVIGEGIEVPQIAGTIDLLPTLADLAGIDYEIEKSLDGLSLKPLLFGNEDGWQDRLIFSHWGGRTSVRNQQYRLDTNNQLFDMVNDPGQYVDVSQDMEELTAELIMAKDEWGADILAEYPEEENRPFPIGHPDFEYTQIPARDGTSSGYIRRSNRYPNCSFFTNWISLDDRITWPVEVLESGDFEVTVYYTCPPEDIGATFELRFGSSSLTATIDEAHDPPLRGMENDRVERIESYVKDFQPFNMGTIHLEKGMNTLKLQALDIPGSQVMDFRLMMFKRIGR